jgi:hypothetical protein
MQQTPQKPQYISKSEIDKKRAAQRVRRRDRRRKLRSQVTKETNAIWPYTVKLSQEPDRYEIRQWMKQQFMRTYDPDLDNKDRADVTWDSKWRVFRFAQESHAVLFNMCFS